MMVLASVLRYRVVCSSNPEKPENLYIDICRDGFCSHDLMFEMQKKKYHDDKLERVFNDSRGIMLNYRREDGAVKLIYTKHRDKLAQLVQEKKRALIDPKILAVFEKMTENGLGLTISMPVYAYSDELGQKMKKGAYAQTPQEEVALMEKERKERLEKLKQIRQEFYAQQKYAYAPHLALMIKQLRQSGD